MGRFDPFSQGAANGRNGRFPAATRVSFEINEEPGDAAAIDVLPNVGHLPFVSWTIYAVCSRYGFSQMALRVAGECAQESWRLLRHNLTQFCGEGFHADRSLWPCPIHCVR